VTKKRLDLRDYEMIYAVNYDLVKPGRDYDGLYESIKSLGTWWHYLESTWLVETSKSAAQIFAALQPHIDSNDNVLVIAVGSDYAGWLPKKAWDWIRSHMDRAA